MLADLMPVTKLSVNVLKTLGPRFGIKTDVIDNNLELIEVILKSIQESGKYNTLQDILNDQTLMEEFANLVSPSNANTANQESDALLLQLDSTMTCPRCGHISTLRILQNNSNFKERSNE